jgi:DNA-binding transcriptional ArsR family regulator
MTVAIGANVENALEEHMSGLHHPEKAKIVLSSVLDALSDPTRLAIIVQIAQSAEPEARCLSFLDLGNKTNLAYHFAKLRTAGIVQVRQAGTARYLSLRRNDLDSRFPGLLDSIIAAASRRKRAAPRHRARS